MLAPRHNKDEFAQRGDTIYENEVEPRLTSEHVGKFVAIDIESGAYEIGHGLLEGSELRIEVVEGGQVIITPLVPG